MRYWIDFQKLRQELSFEKILEQYNVKLHRKGDQATGPCPLPGHTGERKTGSFSANVPKGIFQCFSCKGQGNLFDFAVLMEGRNPKNGQDLRQTGIELAKRYGLQHVGSEIKTRPKLRPPPNTGNGKPSPPPAPPERPQAPLVNTELPFTLQDLDPTHPYLSDRGFTPATIETFGLGFCKKGRLAGRIAIPIHDWHGHLIAYAGRLVDESAISNENPKYLFPGTRMANGVAHEFRKSLVVYNANRILLGTKHLVIVEGFAAVWWLTQNGFPNCVALMGSSLSREQAKIIRDFVGDHGYLTVFTDGDAPGMRCHDEIRAQLGGAITIDRPSLKLGAQPTDFTKAELEALIVRPESNENHPIPPALSKEDRICGLIREFPSLAILGIEPQDWNPEEFDKRSLKFSQGERSAAQFVLSVWNPNTRWQCGRFDAIEAASRLDEAHRAIITRWLQAPWWP